MNLFPGLGLGPSGSLLTFGIANIADVLAGIDRTAVSRVFTPDRVGIVFVMDKQPRERFVGVGINFKAFLATGESLTDGSVTSDVPGVGTLLRVDGPTVYAIIQGGSAGQEARLTYTGLGNKGSICEGELKVSIIEY